MKTVYLATLTAVFAALANAAAVSPGVSPVGIRELTVLAPDPQGA